MAATVDPDVKKAIESHRQQTITANHQMNLLNSQSDSLAIKLRRFELIDQELQSLPEGVVVYKAVGRMFFRRTIPKLLTDMKSESAQLMKNMESIKASKETVSKMLAASKDALRDILSSKQTT